MFGRELAKNMLAVNGTWEKFHVTGYITKPTATRGNRALQYFFLNGRFIRSRLLSAALEEAYRNQMMTGRFPACVLHITLPPEAVDVNVHPAKTEVKFLREREVFDAVHYAVLSALGKAGARPEMKLPQKPTAPVQPAPQENFFRTMDAAQYRAAVQVNCELLRLYHAIGTVINAHKVWGSRFVENLAADIKLSFPEMKGYSVRNLKYMAKFAEAYSADEFVQPPVAQIPWGHNVVLLDKVADKVERLWYAEQSRKNGWSRNVLVHQIESDLYQRQALAEKVSNFELRLPSPQSELAIQTMKDPYIFDFIPFKTDMLEREIEEALVKDVTKLLLELGTGFAFLGNQYHLNVGGDDFYIDLLFYNLNLRCYVVIELKTGEFKPEYAGQLNFYLSAVDGLLKQKQDNPSVGLLLCKSKNDLVAEYSLKDMSKPIGVSAYQVTSKLPEELEKQLPSVEDIQKRIK